MVSKRSKIIANEGAEVPEGITGDLKETYRYFDMLQANGNYDIKKRQGNQSQPSTYKD